MASPIPVVSSDRAPIKRRANGELLHAYITRFPEKRVLVLGDMVADEYIVGRPARISREAPVLVLHHSDEFICPGGAANVAFNIASLGAQTHVVGVVGSDINGRRLIDRLCDLGIDTSGIFVDDKRTTATKTRIIGRGSQEVQQQIVRIDRVSPAPLDDLLSKRMIDFVSSLLPTIDAVLISDYENGVISPMVVSACLPEARRHEVMVTVDSHGDLFRFKGATVATPNQPEAEATLHRTIDGIDDLEQAGSELLNGMQATAVLLTRGSEGMSLFTADSASPVHLHPSNLKEVFDPTGAGDTTSAVFTLALLSGASIIEAAILSNLAAGEVVKRLGAATISQQELAAAVTAGLPLDY